MQKWKVTGNGIMKELKYIYMWVIETVKPGEDGHSQQACAPKVDFEVEFELRGGEVTQLENISGIRTIKEEWTKPLKRADDLEVTNGDGVGKRLKAGR